MVEYYADLTYITHYYLRITHRMKLIEEINVNNNSSNFKLVLERTNSGRELEAMGSSVEIECNDKQVFSRPVGLKAIPANGTAEQEIAAFSVYHNPSGNGSYSVKIKLQCDQNTALMIATFGTNIVAEINNKNFIPIDQSAPKITDVSVTADRYGLNGCAKFVASHASYPITNVQFTLGGLTREQASVSYEDSGADNSWTAVAADQSYSRILKKTKDLSTYSDIEFAINSIIDSGGSYSYSIEVTAQNGKVTTYNNTLRVPQKVTSISCEETIDMKQGANEDLEYTVYPSNAELPAVKFYSSDPSVATVEEDSGLITAVSDGITIITATTVDGGFTASCTVSVFNTDVFPQLSELRILTAKDISKISSACNFLRGKMIENGIDVPVLLTVKCEGRKHPVADIHNLLEAIESNCQTLKSTAASAGTATDSLPELQSFTKQNINWYIVINNWIVFLNELNEKLN